MTSETCSVDSIHPKNRTETFARQLQNRLRTLSVESERDGLEDTSWNGDQLSSSSDNDIYYDLDSSPGSPVDEIHESSFSGYINLNEHEGIFPSCTSNKLVNNNNCSHSLQSINDKEDCKNLEKLYKADSIKNFNNHDLLDRNKAEKELIKCEACTKGEHFDTFSQTSVNNINNTGSVRFGCSSHNGSINFSQDPFLEKTDKLEKSSFDTGYKNNNNSINGEEFSINKKSIVSERLSNEIIETNEKNSDDQINNNCINSLVDFQCESLENGQYIDAADYSINTSSDSNLGCSFGIENKKMTLLTNNISSSKQNLEEDVMENNKITKDSLTYVSLINDESEASSEIQYTEDDLCRLVDVVFSQNEQLNNDSEKINSVDSEETYDDEEEVESLESKRSRFRRSSSLKTGKTPPSTPGCKKIVRFADALGLDLTRVKTFLDEIPKIPKSAYDDLKYVELSSSPVLTSSLDYYGQCASLSTSKNSKTIIPLFQQPSGRPNFIDRVRDNCVCLENAIVSDPVLSVITGIARVKNIDFHKSVHIRYSIDSWKSFADMQAKYIPDSCDGFSDKFSFMLYAHMLNLGQKLEFAIRYHTKGSLFWDNNLGANYAFLCVPNSPAKITSSSFAPLSHSDSWATFY